MEESKILYAVIVVAILALIGRILINREKKGDNIGWSKLIAIALAVVVFVGLFLTFKPHRFANFFAGQATLEEAKTECIAGRYAAKDVNRFASPADDKGQLYYVLQVAELTPTGYFRNRMPVRHEPDVERTVKESETNKEVISRTTNQFAVTKNPGDNQGKYLPLYIARLANAGKVLVALEEEDVPTSISDYAELPVAMMRPTDDKLASIALKTDTTAIADYYFVAFDEDRYARNQVNDYVYRGSAGLLGAIIIALAYLIYRKKK